MRNSRHLFTIILCSLFSLAGTAETFHFQEGFATDKLPTDWSMSGAYFNSNNQFPTQSAPWNCSGNLNINFTGNNYTLTTPTYSGAGKLYFTFAGTAAISQLDFAIYCKVDNGAFTLLKKYTKPISDVVKNITIPIDKTENIQILFKTENRTANGIYLDNISLSQYVQTPTPTVTVEKKSPRIVVSDMTIRITDLQQPTEITLISLLGKVVLRQWIDQSTTLSLTTPGIYLLRTSEGRIEKLLLRP